MIVLPDIIPAAVEWLNAQSEVTDLVDDRISGQLPAEDEWPAVRLDLIGGFTVYEFRLERPVLQVHAFAETDLEARTVARTVRAALFAMVGYRRPGDLVVCDVETSSPQLLPDESRTPPISHATFSATITVRPDP